MMNRLTAFILLFFSMLLAGCVEDSERRTMQLGGETFTGVIPCADCEGTAYRLTLKEGSVYESRSVYVGKSNRPVTATGEWSKRGDSLLVLDAGEEHERSFRLKNRQLILLNEQGKEVPGSLAPMQVKGENRIASGDAPPRWESRREQGVDFRAAGNEPSWSLDIDFDDRIMFTTLQGDSVTLSVPPMRPDSVGSARILQADNRTDSLQVLLYPKGCLDDMSGEYFSHMVQVKYLDTSYTGCGNFINRQYRLHDIWKLVVLHGSKLSEKEAQAAPQLQFDLGNRRVYGTTGCNNITGTINLADSSLAFTKMITTKKACPGDTEAHFLAALEQVESYRIAGGELLLAAGQDTVMRFRRAE